MTTQEWQEEALKTGSKLLLKCYLANKVVMEHQTTLLSLKDGLNLKILTFTVLDIS